jgi:rfaE bifunctional protein nucleotidyltransferase chain/domain
MLNTKIVSREEAISKVNEWQRKGETVVFTNGCFDIIHAGHVTYLNDAKALGSKLVVAINSDASVQRLKGPQRPVVDQSHRAIVLAGLEAVDLVLIFEEDTPIETIKALRPNIHCKGGDYSENDLPETPIIHGYGGQVKIIPFLPGCSTSSIIAKITNSQPF